MELLGRALGVVGSHDRPELGIQLHQSGRTRDRRPARNTPLQAPSRRPPELSNARRSTADGPRPIVARASIRGVPAISRFFGIERSPSRTPSLGAEGSDLYSTLEDAPGTYVRETPSG